MGQIARECHQRQFKLKVLCATVAKNIKNKITRGDASAAGAWAGAGAKGLPVDHDKSMRGKRTRTLRRRGGRSTGSHIERV